MTDGTDTDRRKPEHILIHKRGAMALIGTIVAACITAFSGLISSIIEANGGSRAGEVQILFQRTESLRQRADRIETEIRHCNARVDVLDRKFTILRDDWRQAREE